MFHSSHSARKIKSTLTLWNPHVHVISFPLDFSNRDHYVQTSECTLGQLVKLSLVWACCHHFWVVVDATRRSPASITCEDEVERRVFAHPVQSLSEKTSTIDFSACLLRTLKYLGLSFRNRIRRFRTCILLTSLRTVAHIFFDWDSTLRSKPHPQYQAPLSSFLSVVRSSGVLTTFLLLSLICDSKISAQIRHIKSLSVEYDSHISQISQRTSLSSLRSHQLLKVSTVSWKRTSLSSLLLKVSVFLDGLLWLNLNESSLLMSANQSVGIGRFSHVASRSLSSRALNSSNILHFKLSCFLDHLKLQRQFSASVSELLIFVNIVRKWQQLWSLQSPSSLHCYDFNCRSRVIIFFAWAYPATLILCRKICNIAISIRGRNFS